MNAGNQQALRTPYDSRKEIATLVRK